MPTDIASAIVPKSDQLNADDLIAGPIVVRLGRTRVSPGSEQPVSVEIEDVAGVPRKPWRPCKTMLRLLTEAWGTSDADQWIGRHVRLVRDPSVKYGGSEVGGIRVSGLSDIARDFTAQLTVTRGKRAPYRVEKLSTPAPQRQPATAAPQDWRGPAVAALGKHGISMLDAVAKCGGRGVNDWTDDDRATLRTMIEASRATDGGAS